MWQIVRTGKIILFLVNNRLKITVNSFRRTTTRAKKKFYNSVLYFLFSQLDRKCIATRKKVLNSQAVKYKLQIKKITLFDIIDNGVRHVIWMRYLLIIIIVIILLKVKLMIIFNIEIFFPIPRNKTSTETDTIL